VDFSTIKKDVGRNPRNTKIEQSLKSPGRRIITL